MYSVREIRKVLKDFDNDVEAIAESLVEARNSIHDLELQVYELEKRVKELEAEAERYYERR